LRREDGACKQRYNKDVKIGLIRQSLGVRVILKLVPDRVDRSLTMPYDIEVMKNKLQNIKKQVDETLDIINIQSKYS
jgi:hypothetical protein